MCLPEQVGPDFRFHNDDHRWPDPAQNPFDDGRKVDGKVKNVSFPVRGEPVGRDFPASPCYCRKYELRSGKILMERPDQGLQAQGFSNGTCMKPENFPLVASKAVRQMAQALANAGKALVTAP